MADFIDLESVSKRLKDLVNRSGMSAKDFANSTGIPPSTLSQIQNGKTLINIDSINKIVDYWQGQVGFDPMWFLFGEAHTYSSKSEDIAESLPTSSSTESALQTALTDRIEEIAKLRATLELMKPKVIDHITVFYSDSSFETYRLSAESRE